MPIQSLRICIATVAGLFAMPVIASEDEIARYGPVLKTCYADADAADALSVCIGQMAEACKDGEDGGWSTLGISLCNAAETKVWDTHLNDVYQNTLETFRAWDKDEAKNFPEFANAAEALRDAQRAWIAFRDGECGLAYAFWGAGSVRNVAASECQLRMTAERVIDLRALTEAR